MFFGLIALIVIIAIVIPFFMAQNEQPTQEPQIQQPTQPTESQVTVIDTTDCEESEKISAYVDTDNDNYGSGQEVKVCPAADGGLPFGYSLVAGDCNSNNAEITLTQQFYIDNDGDGYGLESTRSDSLCNQPVGYAKEVGDCDDHDADMNPGETTPEYYSQGSAAWKDYNCNGEKDMTIGTIFVTREGFDADMGGLAGADSNCMSAATAESISGTWIALLSTSTVDAVDRLPETAFTTIRGEELADNKVDLFTENLKKLISFTERGIIGENGVWTGSDTDGTYDVDSTCADWTSTSTELNGRTGNNRYTSDRWIKDSRTTCATESMRGRLYCVRTS